MKKHIILLLSLFCFSNVLLAQNTHDKYWGHKYRNIGFVNTTFSQENIPDLKSNYGANFSIGRTYFLHKRPILGILRIGLDATWFDINYTNYDVEHITYQNSEKYQIHEGEVGMQIGPSITLNPFSKWNIHGYARFAPSYSMFYIDDEFQGEYASFFVAGGSISYKHLGLGFEARMSNCKQDVVLPWIEDQSAGKVTTKTKGFRAFISLRF